MRIRVGSMLFLCWFAVAAWAGDAARALCMICALPDLALTTVQGESVSLESFKGEWVVVDFWATWCKPCVTTMPELDAWSKTGDVRVVGIAIDEGKDHEKKVQKFLEEHPVGYPIALDVADKPVWQSYKVKILPTLLLIDPSGQIVARQVGNVDLVTLRTMVAAGKKR
jgi:thiol-disulfide isomerase/thioredoxin